MPIDKSREQIIDEFGEVDRQVLGFKPTLARHKALQAQILGWYLDLPGDQTITAEGKLYTVQVGMRENKRTLTNVKRAFRMIQKAIGLDDLLGLITLPLKAIDQHIAIADQRTIVKQERTGPRDLTVVAKAPVAAAQKAA